MAEETIITFFNKKGGTGKTSLSFNLAKDLDYFLLSNDDSVIEKVYPEKSKIMEELEVVRGANIIYDLGGFIEKETIEVFKVSDLIIVPTTLDINSIQRTINTVIELNEYNDNIVIVVNRIQKAKANKYKNSLEALAKLDKEILLIRESEAFINSMYKGETVIEQYKSSPLLRNAYKGIVEDYMKLLKTIQEVKGK